MEMIWAFQVTSKYFGWNDLIRLFNILFARLQIPVSSESKKFFDDPKIIFSWIYGKKVKLYTVHCTHYSALIFWSFVCIFFSPPFCADSLSKYYIDDISEPKPHLIIFIPHIHISSSHYDLTRSSYQAFVFRLWSFLPCEYINSNGFVESKTRKHYTLHTVPKQRGAFSLRMKNDE